uniref:Dysbindin domain-containing protein 1 n=1 Tax=Marmota marmota marmota TaxID=9994 RepID=A0A8C5Z2Z5_MARMA
MNPDLDGKILLVAEIIKEAEVPPAALGVPAHGTESSCHTPVAEEEVGIPIPAPGLLQVTERRQPLSSVSSLEVHFDLLDLTELTDMSDQELAEVFADSDDENLTSESPAGLHPLPRAGCLRSPSWTKTRAEQNREKQPLSDPERQADIVDTFLTVEGPKEVLTTGWRSQALPSAHLTSNSPGHAILLSLPQAQHQSSGSTLGGHKCPSVCP